MLDDKIWGRATTGQAILLDYVIESIQKRTGYGDKKTNSHYSQKDKNKNTSKNIAQLNDLFRQTFIGGKVLLTNGVRALDDEAVANIIKQVKDFNNFNRNNDPYKEHDFGSVKSGRKKFFWKIDYYDKNLEYHSPDKADPKVTERVLTIMLANEY